MMGFDSNFLELLAAWFAAGDMPETAKRLREIAERLADLEGGYANDDA